jgi:hypothetical protein
VSADYRAKQRQALEDALDLLAKQYAAALRDSALKDGAAQVQADQQAAEIDQRMQRLQQRVDALALAPIQPNCPSDRGPEPDRAHDLLQARLHRIDFAQVEGLVIAPRGGIHTCPVDRPCKIEERVKGTGWIAPSGTIRTASGRPQRSRGSRRTPRWACPRDSQAS